MRKKNKKKENEKDEPFEQQKRTKNRTDGATAYSVDKIEMCFWVQTDVSDLWMKF